MVPELFKKMAQIPKSEKGSNYVILIIKIMGRDVFCCLIILSTNIKYQSNICNSYRDIEGNVNFGNKISIKRDITLVNGYRVTSFWDAHNIMCC